MKDINDLSQYMILLTIQQQRLTGVAMTCCSLGLRRSFSHYMHFKTLFFRYIIAKGRVTSAEGRAG